MTDGNEFDVYNFKLESVEKPLNNEIIRNIF